MAVEDDRVTAVTIAYHPDTAVLERQFAALGKQVHCILVDNGSDNVEELGTLASRHEQVELVALGENTGIAHAQNVGIREARRRQGGTSFILFLDQDSVPGEGMVSKLLEKFHEIRVRDPAVGAVGPCLIDVRDGRQLGFHVMSGMRWRTILPGRGEDFVRVTNLNSSGTLVSVDTLDRVGGPDDSLFIDHVDTEWSFRLLSRGYTLYGTTAATMDHSMGDSLARYWLFGWRSMPYRSPLRHYYLVRNSILLQRMPHVAGGWKFWNVIKLLFTFVYFGLFVGDRRRQRRSMFKGLAHGVCGRTGRAFSGMSE